MPYTAAQRKLFHYREKHPGGGLKESEARRLADEADELAGGGRERPAKKSNKDLADSLVRVLAKALRQGEHASPPAGYPTDPSSYASPHDFMFPLDTHEHVRAAIGYFSHHKWGGDEHKAEAARRILHAAKRHGIHVSNESDVHRAAHGKG